MTTVSVCVQGSPRLGNMQRSLESLAAQTYGVFGIIVTEDCPLSDGILYLANKYGAYLSLPLRVGNEFRYAQAQNMAVGYATGDIVVCTQADIIYPPNFLSDTVAALCEYGEKAVVIPDVQRTDPAKYIPTPIGPLDRWNAADCPVVSMWRAQYVPMNEAFDQYRDWWGPAWSCDLARAGMRFYCAGAVTHIDHETGDILHTKSPFGRMLFNATYGHQGQV